MGELSANFDTLVDKIKENNWEVHGIEVYYRKQVQLPIIECGAEDAPFIGSEGIASDKTYYRKQMQFPIIEYGDVTARRYPIYSATKTITSLNAFGEGFRNGVDGK